ncbi:hypothetical protein HaLaN_16305 [Haematococcus lacustris]|uniref:Uncharacterized protein n=1 Tax=Haematococcus lacustris TaxID=44745 RepID=A0A699ZK58_HAELA|nr:hypothetical protein HaLaN_16305 [Haematococcus lacustris]
MPHRPTGGESGEDGGRAGRRMRKKSLQTMCKRACTCVKMPPWSSAVLTLGWLITQAKQRWPDRVLALAYGAAGFSGSGSVGCRGVPVSQMLKEALRQFPAGRVLMVDEFCTSRVSSAYSNPSDALPGQPPEAFRWLRPVYSAAKRSQVRVLMCSTSNNISRAVHPPLCSQPRPTSH